MTGLTIRADELIMLFEGFETEMQHFFDRQTGEVLSLYHAEEVEEDRERIEADPDRYLRIEPVPSWVGYEIMCDFVEALPEGKVQQELARALERRKPFRGFKDVLLNYPQVREDWFRFHELSFIKIIQEWLEDNGVAATLVPFNPQP